MVNRNALRNLALAAGVATLTLSGWANADPPSVVARLGYITGAVIPVDGGFSAFSGV